MRLGQKQLQGDFRGGGPNQGDIKLKPKQAISGGHKVIESEAKCGLKRMVQQKAGAILFRGRPKMFEARHILLVELKRPKVTESEARHILLVGPKRMRGETNLHFFLGARPHDEQLGCE